MVNSIKVFPLVSRMPLIKTYKFLREALTSFAVTFKRSCKFGVGYLMLVVF